jgi:hypothetical protein
MKLGHTQLRKQLHVPNEAPGTSPLTFCLIFYAVMILAVPPRIHSFLDICSSALLPPVLCIPADLQINTTSGSIKATSLLQSIILKPRFALHCLRDCLSEFALQVSGKASKFIFRHATKPRRKGPNTAEVEGRISPVTALHRLVSSCFDRQQSPTSRLAWITQNSGSLKASGYGSHEASHQEHLLYSREPPNTVSFPTIATKPQRRNTNLTHRLSDIDPSSLLDDKIAAELLALVPGASGICLWLSGELQILAPHLTIEEAAELELPESSRISISVSRWSPKPTCVRGPSLLHSPDSDGRLLNVTAENGSARGSPLALNNDSNNTSSVIDSSPSMLQVEALLGEQKVAPAKAHRSTSLSPKVPDRSWISQIKGLNFLRPGTSRTERNQLYNNGACLQPQHAVCKLDSMTGLVRPAGMQDAQIMIGSGKTHSTVPAMKDDHRECPDVAEAAPDFMTTVSRFSSRSEPVRHGDAGTSLARASTLINCPAKTKSIVAPQARRSSSAPQLRPASVQHTTPPAETPPPADPEPVPPQPALVPALPPRHMNNESRIFVGPRSHCATAGVKIRRRNGDGEQYLTISTHAAFNGVNEKPIPICVPKKPNFFKKPKPVRGVTGASVLDAEDSSLVCR